MQERVKYEELTPNAFLQRRDACPVAYLPLGTLEWHGPHLPLGTDLLEAEGFFLLAASRIGGIVMPGLFLGPDRSQTIGETAYYGMDLYMGSSKVPKPYPIQQLPGSAYWVEDDFYNMLLLRIFRQLARAGFQVVVGCGHGPSCAAFSALAQEAKALGLTLLTVDQTGDSPRYVADHAGPTETANILCFYPELVQLQNLPKTIADYPPGIAAMDLAQLPQASDTAGKLDTLLSRLEDRITAALSPRRNNVLQQPGG